MPSRKKKVRPLTASQVQAALAYSLEDSWVGNDDQPSCPTNNYPMRLQRAPALLPAADGKMWPRTFGWPLTLDESRRLSPVEALRKAEAERTKPTDKKLGAWFLMRCLDAEAVAPDLDTQHRLMRDAYNDLLSAMAVAYSRQRRDNHAQTQAAAFQSVTVRGEDSTKWRDHARKVLARGGDEKPVEMATRIYDELTASGWVRYAEWKYLSKTERRDSDMGYVPAVDEIARFLREVTKNQPQ